MPNLTSAFALMDAAIAQGEPPAAAPPAPASLGPEPVSADLQPAAPSPTPSGRMSTADAMAHIDSVLAQPAALPVAARARGDAGSQTIPDDRGADAALNTVEGTGRENYDAGPAEDGLTPMERVKGLPGLGVNAVAQAAQGVPVVGAAVNKAAAGLASLVNGKSVADNEATGQTVSDDFAAAHPGITTASRLAGGIVGTAPLMAAAPEAFGLGEGSFLARGAAAVGSNAAVSGADAAARGEDVGKAAAIGGALGALGPAAEAGVAGARVVGKAADKAAGPIIAGLQLRGAKPGDLDALLSNARTAQGAADKVRSFSSDPATLDARVAAAPDAATPGVTQTLSGAVGDDMGLFQAERAARTVDNSAFNTLDAQRSAASLDALQGVQPTGDVFAPGKMLRSRLDAIDADADAAESRLTSAQQAGATERANASQAFADRQQAGLAARQDGRAQAQQSDAVTATADLAGRVADRTDAAAAAKATGDAGRQAGLDALAQGHAAQEAGLQGAAQDAAGALGPVVAPEQAGATLRGAVEDARATARQARSDLYKQIDPDGSLALVSSPVRDAAASISQGIDPYSAPLTADTTRLLGKARALPDVMPFSSLTAFESDITAAMSAERRTAGETNSLRLMGDLKSSVRDAISNAADNQAAHEGRMVAGGQMQTADTMEARLGGDFAFPGDATYRTAAARAGDFAGVQAPVGSPALSRARGTGAPGAERLDAAPGGSGGSSAPGGGQTPALTDPRFSAPAYDPAASAQRAPQRPDMPRPQSLSAFVRSRGGMTDPGADLATMGEHRLISRGGVDPDKMREAAAEAGYLGGDTGAAMRETTPADLFNALESGDRTYSVRDYDAVHAWDQHDQAREAYDRAKGGDPAMREAGPRPKAPLSSYAPEDIYAPGTIPDPANDGLRPNFDEAAADRLKAAKAGHAEYAQTYRSQPVAAAIKTNGFAGQYVAPDGAVMAKAFHPGDRGYEDAQAFLKAANGDPRAIQAMGDYALNGLRTKIGPTGTLAQKDVDRWAAAHAPAIRAMQEALPGFTDAVSTAAAADRTLVAAGLANKAERDTAQRQAAAEALAADQERTSTLRGQNAADRDNTTGQIAARREADRAADAEDRAGVGALIAERRSDDAAINARSTADMASGIKQVRDVAKAAQATPAGQFARTAGNAVAPTEVANTVGGLLSTGKAGAARMRGLVASVKDDPEALAGLRRAGVEYMLDRLTKADGTLSDAQAIKFFRDNRDTLAELYPHEQRAKFGAIAVDAMRGNAYADATKVRGSDTAKNTIAYFKGGAAGEALKHLSLMNLASEAIGQGFERGGIKGALMGGAGAAGAYLTNGLRGAGIRGVKDLVDAAMSDHKVAQLLLSKAPTAANMRPAHVLVGMLRRAAIFGGATMGAQSSPQPAQRAAPLPPVPAQPRGRLLSDFVGQ